MTRRKGTVPVRISRHRAEKLAKWLQDYSLPLKSLIGTAGLSELEIEAVYAQERQSIMQIVLVLSGSVRGRPRKAVSTYHLPRVGLRLIDNGHAAYQMPRKLRPVVRSILRRTSLKKGPNLPLVHRQQNMTNGIYAPETIRRYIWQAAKLERMALHHTDIKWFFSVNGTQENELFTSTIHTRTILSAHRWLI